MDDLNLPDFWIQLTQELLQVANQLIQRRTITKGGIVNCIYGLWIGGRHRQHIHLDHIVNIGEIA